MCNSRLRCFLWLTAIWGDNPGTSLGAGNQIGDITERLHHRAESSLYRNSWLSPKKSRDIPASWEIDQQTVRQAGALVIFSQSAAQASCHDAHNRIFAGIVRFTAV